MTKQEAFDLIKSDGLYSQEVIDALEQEPCENANAIQHNSNALNALEGDAISRQAVLKTLDDMDNVLDEDRTIGNYKELLKECYEVLPSVNPQEPRTGHCKDCKSFREIPYHSDICIQHSELCPKGDWYCADFKPQESNNCN